MKLFSGLTLMIHLVIIGVGKIIFLLKSQETSKSHRFVLQKKETLTAFDYGASVSTIAILMAVMLTFFGVAIKTSIREGADEWQRKQLKIGLVFLGNSVSRFGELTKTETGNIMAKIFDFNSITIQAHEPDSTKLTHNEY